jgi:hypothetical protein
MHSVKGDKGPRIAASDATESVGPPEHRVPRFVSPADPAASLGARDDPFPTARTHPPRGRHRNGSNKRSLCHTIRYLSLKCSPALPRKCVDIKI